MPYVVTKQAFTASNSVWVQKLCDSDSVYAYTSSVGADDKVTELEGAETGSRQYTWEFTG